jgi:hypothetical protein
MIYEFENNLPVEVRLDDGGFLKIRNDCDYRVVLRCFKALNDEELTMQQRTECCLIIFYENYEEINENNLEIAVKEMFKIINCGEEEVDLEEKPRIMDWEHDFKHIVAPINRVLGYDIRTPDRYLHWWSFCSSYQEIGDCVFATVISIRQKKFKGKRLEKWEEEFYRDNRKMIDLPYKLTAEEEEFLNSDW